MIRDKAYFENRIAKMKATDPVGNAKLIAKLTRKIRKLGAAKQHHRYPGMEQLGSSCVSQAQDREFKSHSPIHLKAETAKNRFKKRQCWELKKVY